MNTILTNKDFFDSLIIHSKRLSPEKKAFVIKILNKYGIMDAFYALYTVLFVIKDEKELLTYHF